jgi:WD40 repeat protein
MAFDPTGRTLAIGCGDCTVRLWDYASGGAIRQLSHCDADMFGDLAIGSVQFSQDGSRLLAASWSYWEVRVWDLASGLILDHFDFSTGAPAVMPAWFAANDEYVVMSLACRFARIDGSQPTTSEALNGGLKLIPGGYPKREEFAWWNHDGDYAWAVVDHHLVVRKIPDEEPVMRVEVRER